MSRDRTDWLRHPLVSLVLGFLLTGVIGTAITQNYLDQREQERLRAQIAIDRTQAIVQFSQRNEERTVRAEMLLNALRTGMDDDELESARQEYEKAYVAWSMERQSTLLMFRNLLSSENYELVESRFKESLIGKLFNPIRSCLTTALDQRANKAESKMTLADCRIDELLELSSTCSLALAAAVSDLAGAHSEWVAEGELAKLREKARKSIDRQCP